MADNLLFNETHQKSDSIDDIVLNNIKCGETDVKLCFDKTHRWLLGMVMVYMNSLMQMTYFFPFTSV